MFFTDEERKLLQEVQSSGGLDFSYKGGEEYSIGEDTFEKFDRSTAIRLLPDLTEKFAKLDNLNVNDLEQMICDMKEHAIEDTSVGNLINKFEKLNEPQIVSVSELENNIHFGNAKIWHNIS